MKRRNFFGFAAGAAIAGPKMAKHAVAETLGDLSLALPSTGLGYGGGMPQVTSDSGSNQWAFNNLAKLVGRTAEQHAYFKRQQFVNALDPDLASYGSMSLSARIAMQRERDYERSLNGEKGYLEATIKGWFS